MYTSISRQIKFSLVEQLTQDCIMKVAVACAYIGTAVMTTENE